jgi:RNA recognition motif-containing protein
MSSYKQNYLKSCFLSLILTLIYIVLVPRFMKQFSTDSLFQFSAIYIFVCGLIVPLTFFFAGKFTTNIKEPARPHIDISDTDSQEKVNLQDIAKHAINSNPTTKARSPLLENNEYQSSAINNKTKFHEEEISEEIVTIYIGNIPFKVNDTGLKDLFKPFGGTIYYAHLSRDAKTKKRKGIGFVKISKVAGLKAIEQLNGSSLLGREIVVKIANERGQSPITENLDGK